MPGAPSAMTRGTTTVQLLFVNSLDNQVLVRICMYMGGRKTRYKPINAHAASRTSHTPLQPHPSILITAATSFKGARFGPGDGPILLDDTKCSGSEESLWECQARTALTHNCDHTEDAGVSCQG